MSGSMAPSPPVAGGRLGLCLRLGLVLAISLVWNHVPHGMPGTPALGDGPLDCPICGLPGGKRPDGKYVCEKGHVFTAEQAELPKADAAKAETAKADAAQAEAAKADAAQAEAPAEAASAEAIKGEG